MFGLSKEKAIELANKKHRKTGNDYYVVYRDDLYSYAEILKQGFGSFKVVDIFELRRDDNLSIVYETT